MSDVSLFNEFNSISKSKWIDKVSKDLKGKPLDTLNWASGTLKGDPFYHSEDSPVLELPLCRTHQQNSWKSGAIITGPSYQAINERAIALLELGAQVLRIEIEELSDLIDFEVLLKGIQLEWVSIEFNISQDVDCVNFITSYVRHIEEQGFDLNKINGACFVKNVAQSDFKKIEHYINSAIGIKLLLVYTHKPGKEITEELSDLILHMVQLIEAFPDINPEKLLDIIQIETIVSDHYYGSLCKLRAIRLLIDRLMDSYGIVTIEDPIISVRLLNTIGTEDINTDRIRLTSQLSSAVIGGADVVYNYHDTEAIILDSRIVENMNNTLAMEGFLDRVIDPAAGSYFYENLTNQICQYSWSKFQLKVQEI